MPLCDTPTIFDDDIKLEIKKPFLRSDEVSGILNCSTKHVHRLLDAREFEGVHLNLIPNSKSQDVRIITKSVEEFINRRRKMFLMRNADVVEEPGKLMTIKEVMAFLKCTMKRVECLILTGALKKVGQRITRESVERVGKKGKVGK